MEASGSTTEAAAAAAPLSAPVQHLVESTLYKEDVRPGGHKAVWGSWYDTTQKRWGFACCKGFDRNAPCPNASAEDQAKDGEDSGIEVTSPDSEDQTEHDPWDFSKAPTELKPYDGMRPAAYIEHWCMYHVGEWVKQQETGYVGFGGIEKQAFATTHYANLLKDCQDALTPLLWRLKRGVSLERGEAKETRRSRETRTSMEGKFVKEKSVLKQLHLMATSSANQDYVAAHAAYMHLTFGNKMWNLTHVAHVAACTMKGAREYRRNRDSLNTYDMDPISQKYMHAMKKLCYLAQCIKPNSDQSKNVVM